MMSSDLLGCGASKTMCGKEWLTQYVNNLTDEDQQVPLGIPITYTDLGMVGRSNLYILLKSLPSLEATNLI